MVDFCWHTRRNLHNVHRFPTGRDHSHKLDRLVKYPPRDIPSNYGLLQSLHEEQLELPLEKTEVQLFRNNCGSKLIFCDHLRRESI